VKSFGSSSAGIPIPSNRSAPGRVLHRVRQQVVKNLHEALPIRRDFEVAVLHFEYEFVPLALRGEEADDLLDHVLDRGGGDVQLDGAGLDA
jgi:hypothetical protein